MTKDWLFISDVHLRERDWERQTAIVRFLQTARESLGTLVILGDLFEFWFGFEHFAYEGYKPVLDALEELVSRGIHIRYVEGNHDFALGSYFESTLKAEIDTEDAAFDLDDKRIYMAHGDLANRGDPFYPMFRRILKNNLTYWMMRRTGPSVCKKLAVLLGSISAGRRDHRNPTTMGKAFEGFALMKLRGGFDVVILAHSHLPMSRSFEIDGRLKQYFNVGDWTRHFSFLRYRTNCGFELGYFRP